ncbi:SRPBCC family protein [Streptomyces albidoflavus]|uniref:SRPBCC family protein n=1 Tax=Streptomyces albidoflavus TaxID=1886 RepID=UPI00116446FB|nr:SRPBCC domain-containing protein [Streptomyces albidoflavus]MCR0987655.1 SRPBCC domain-containing protein [Streptomyces albidoflavus]QDD60348.1 SRPBCC domain-containing protein [Streptomyces albidoflavus]WTC03740.1 SRPBCC domain-containing protein [Streptomyces albidoflavus]
MSAHTTTGFPYRVSRVMDATAARAWEAYTTAAEWQEWFGAEEGSAELDVRVGGVWKCVLLGPDGGRYPLGGTFLEVEEGRRFVLSMAVPGAPDEVMGVTFEEAGGGVEVTIDQTNATAEECARAREGSTMILANLAAHVEG